MNGNVERPVQNAVCAAISDHDERECRYNVPVVLPPTMITKYLRPRSSRTSFCNLRRLGEPGPRRRLCVTIPARFFARVFATFLDQRWNGSTRLLWISYNVYAPYHRSLKNLTMITFAQFSTQIFYNSNFALSFNVTISSLEIFRYICERNFDFYSLATF